MPTNSSTLTSVNPASLFMNTTEVRVLEPISVGLNLLRGPGEHDLPVDEHQCAIGEAQREVDVLLNKNHSGTALCCSSAKTPEEAANHDRSEAGAHLIDEKDLRFLDH